jgi:hypothetical protein
MRLNRVLCCSWLCIFSAASSGCGVAATFTRRVIIDQLAYCDSGDAFLSCARNRVLARSAWEEFEGANRDCKHSPDFASGFTRGFVDYLDFGSANPPPIPPRRYWKVCYQSPEGHLAIDDWFAGYRSGASAAEQSGYRSYITIPTLVPPKWATEPVTVLSSDGTTPVEYNPEIIQDDASMMQQQAPHSGDPDREADTQRTESEVDREHVALPILPESTAATWRAVNRTGSNGIATSRSANRTGSNGFAKRPESTAATWRTVNRTGSNGIAKRPD